MAAVSHPFPFRTRKLSPPAPMVLGGPPPGRVGRRRIFSERAPSVRTGLVCVFLAGLRSELGAWPWPDRRRWPVASLVLCLPRPTIVAVADPVAASPLAASAVARARVPAVQGARPGAAASARRRRAEMAVAHPRLERR